MIGRLAAVMDKEFRHIVRDGRSLLIIFLMPMLMTVLYGYAINLDLRDLPMGVVNHDGSTAADDLVRSFESSGLFAPPRRYPHGRAVQEGMARREVVLAVVIPPGWGAAEQSPDPLAVQLLVDGSNGNTAAVALGYAQAIVGERARARLLEQAGVALPVEAVPRFWYNPEQVSSHFVVPGLIAVILMMAGALLTSVTIVRERESGTLEQLLVSPIRRGELIVGKVLPYGLLALIDGAIVLGIGTLHFGVPVQGSLLLLLGLTALYLMAALGIGLLISTVARRQEVAMLLALLVTVMPAFMLSNFIFPLRSMPTVLQWVSHVVPARYYMPVVRGVLLKGVGLEVLWPQALFLAGFALLLTALSIARFRAALD